MDKYFLIIETKYEGTYVETFENEKSLLDAMGSKTDTDNKFRVIRGKELKIIPKEVVIKYEVER